MPDARVYGLTPIAYDCLNYIHSFSEAAGVMPTHLELAKLLGLRSTGQVNRILHQLETRGHIRRLYRRARAIEIIPAVIPMAVDIPPDLQGALLSAAREAGRTPEEHVAVLVRDHCPAPSPF